MRLAREILLGESRIQERVRELAAQITAETPPGGTLHVLALMDGAFMFCADLVRRLPLPVRLAFVPVVSVGRGGQPDQIELPAGFDVAGADLLVVEDVLDTGLTLAALRARLESLGPRRIRLAVLLDKPARRAAAVSADYVGFRIADRWVVGYGLDSEQLYRNLPYLTYLE
ncbi:MAG TPA: phosphoribosyltransferase family protein [Candidatus Polarisedimenticolaceae bacterium]|nr:phosphoribosyltransferase family protein [Candidatus Polarisedimenticolaceae bacterium]